MCTHVTHLNTQKWVSPLWMLLEIPIDMCRKIKDFVLGIRIYILREKIIILWEEKKIRTNKSLLHPCKSST